MVCGVSFIVRCLGFVCRRVLFVVYVSVFFVFFFFLCVCGCLLFVKVLGLFDAC